MNQKRRQVTGDVGTIRDRFLQFPWEILVFVIAVIGISYYLQR